MNSAHIDLLLRLTGLFGTLWAGLLLLKFSRKGSPSRDHVGLISGRDVRVAYWGRLGARGIIFIFGVIVVGFSAWSIRDLVMRGDAAVTVLVPSGQSANVSVKAKVLPDGSAHGVLTQGGDGSAADAGGP